MVSLPLLRIQCDDWLPGFEFKDSPDRAYRNKIHQLTFVEIEWIKNFEKKDAKSNSLFSTSSM